jgi:hypothetical protein
VVVKQTAVCFTLSLLPLVAEEIGVRGNWCQFCFREEIGVSPVFACSGKKELTPIILGKKN